MQRGPLRLFPMAIDFRSANFKLFPVNTGSGESVFRWASPSGARNSIFPFISSKGKVLSLKNVSRDFNESSRFQVPGVQKEVFKNVGCTRFSVVLMVAGDESTRMKMKIRKFGSNKVRQEWDINALFGGLV